MHDGQRYDSSIARLFSDNKSVCPKVYGDRNRVKCGTLQTRMQQVSLVMHVSRVQQQAEAYVETEAAPVPKNVETSEAWA